VRIRQLAILVLCLAMASAALADVVHMKNGRKVEGEIIERTKTVIRIRSKAGTIRNLRIADVKKVEVAGGVLPGSKKKKKKDADDPRSADTKRYEEQMGRKLNVVTKPRVLVRGDHPHDELQKIADAAEMTVLHFIETFECDVKTFLKGKDGYAGRVEVFQFRKEKAYLKFMDKVYDRLRDRKSVNDERFKMMRRNRGFWVLDPVPIIGGYMGPSPFESCISNVSHKTSHVLLELYETRYWKRPWWLYEGLATWQEIQITGKSLTYCLEPAGPASYAKDGTPEADELKKAQTAKLWRAHIRRKVKAREEKDLKVLGRLSLNELHRDEVIQSWSVVDWISRKGKLKAFVKELKKNDQNLDKAFSTVLGYGVEAAHEKWRAWVLAAR
jgi:hypothetical protein